MTIDASTVFAVNEQASLQAMGDGAVILLAGSGQLYTCNDTVEFFLNTVDGHRNFEEIVQLFVAEFEVDETTARNDLARLSAEMVAEGILESA